MFIFTYSRSMITSDIVITALSIVDLQVQGHAYILRDLPCIRLIRAIGKISVSISIYSRSGITTVT